MGYTRQEIKSIIGPLERLLADIKCNTGLIAEGTDPAVSGGVEAIQMVEVDPATGEEVAFFRVYSDGVVTNISTDGTPYTVTSEANVHAVNSATRPRILHSEYTTPFTTGGTITSPWLNMSDVDKIQITGKADVAGCSITIESRSDAAEPITTTTTLYTDGPLYLANIPARQSKMRFTWENTTGGDVAFGSLEIKATYGSSDKLSVFPVGVQPSDFSQAALVQSITRGLSPEGEYLAVGVNDAGALHTADFGTDVARGLYPKYSIDTKFGRNPDVTTGPEDIWFGGGDYTGFNAFSGQAISVVSASPNDAGVLKESGTVGTVTANGIIDPTASFITQGVSMLDMYLNDSLGVYAIVLGVVSETELLLTESRTSNGRKVVSSVGDAYRIAASTGTGAAVVQLGHLIDGTTYTQQTDAFVILNGTTPVTTINSNYVRCSRAKVIKAGSGGFNAGVITVRQAITTANVFATMPTTGQTTIGAFTVPSNKIMIIKNTRVSISRENGASGSATVGLFIRNSATGAWNGVRVFEVQTGGAGSFVPMEGGIIVGPAADIKFRALSVSSTNTVVEVGMEYYLTDI